MGARKLFFENIHVGDEIPAMAKAPVDRVQLARYAGATGDFNPIHVDEVHARGLGMPSVYAPSPLGMGFLGQLISDWARGALLRKFGVKFIKIIWPGDTLVCKGRVSDRFGQDGKYFIDLDVWAENQKGELVLKGLATLQVFYSSEDETRFKTGQPPIVVNVPRESIVAAAAAAEEQKKVAATAAASVKGAKPGKAAPTAKKPDVAKAKPKAKEGTRKR
ncbi:MAG: MaoC family dehydratase N-terminal domain-containing protein [Myxococcaceae bacterium]|nr:MaoC family dehydratase N-terminal domain-containing protein [Myxococcaceae bacterium]